MQLDSVRSFKQQVSEEVVAAHGTHPSTVSFFAATEPPMPPAMALGVAKRGSEHVLAIRAEDPAAAAAMAARVHGEADVKIVKVFATPPTIDPAAVVDMQTTPGYLQGKVRPIEPGVQLNIKGANFVGTLGAVVKDAAGRLLALSNSHVLADMGRTPIGTQIGQPFGSTGNLVAVLANFIPYSLVSPNLVDCAIARFDKTDVLRGFNGALQDVIKGVRPASPSDLGVEVVKIGRTTGVQRGKVTAVEVDGLAVNMGDIGVVRFNDQVECSGGPSSDFSAAGDSGSLIIRADGLAIALLFAGGFDGTQDLTFGNRLENVLSALGVELAL